MRSKALLAVLFLSSVAGAAPPTLFNRGPLRLDPPLASTPIAAGAAGVWLKTNGFPYLTGTNGVDLVMAPGAITITATSPLLIDGTTSGTLGVNRTLSCPWCVTTTGSYSDPAWLTALAGAKITGTVANATNATNAGNATTVTNGVYTTGSYSDPSWIASLAGAKIAGAVANATAAVNASTVTNGIYSTGSYADPAWLTSLAGAKITGTVPNATTAGNASTVTNGLYSTGSYADPSWLSSLAGAKITGTVANATTAGNAGSVTNGVYTSGSYSDPLWITSLAGAKITGSVATATTASSVTNGVYTTGSYADPAWITSLAGAKIVGAVASATTASTVTNGVYTTGSYADPAWLTSLAGSKVTGSVANATSAANATTVTNGVYTTSSYADPAWITSLSAGKITGAGVTLTPGTGIAITGGSLALGGTATITNNGVTSAVAGSGVNVSSATGAVSYSIDQTISPNWTGTHIFVNPITVGTPTAAGHAATKVYVDAAISGLDIKPAVFALASSNIATLSGPITVDGVALAAGKRVLLIGQTTQSQNGIWLVQSGAWIRPADYSTGNSVSGSFAFVTLGAVYGATGWVCTASIGSDVVDTNSLTFSQFSGAGTYTNGSGLTLTGTQFSVGAAQITNTMLANSKVTLLPGTGIGIAGGTLALGGTATITNNGVTSLIAGAGINVSAATGVVTVSIPTAGVTNSMLANPSVTVATTGPVTGGGLLALGGTLTVACPTCVVTTDTRLAPTPSTSGRFVVDTGTGYTSRALLAADIPSLSATYLPLAGGTMAGAITFTGTQLGTYTLGGTPTITSGAAVTWSTSSGALTVSGFGGLNLRASASTINLGDLTTTAINIGNSGSTTTFTGTLAFPAASIAGAALATSYVPLAGGTMTGAIVPNADATLDFGASGARWLNFYVKILNSVGNTMTFTTPGAIYSLNGTGGFDRNIAAGLIIGGINATSITLGSSTADTKLVATTAATSGSTIVNSPALHFVGNYWNGTASTALDSNALLEVTNAAGPVSRWSVYVNSLRMFSVGTTVDNANNGKLSAYQMFAGAFDNIGSGTLQIGAQLATSIQLGSSSADTKLIATTAATSGTVDINSPALHFTGNYWTGSATATEDSTIQMRPQTSATNGLLYVSVNGADVAYFGGSGNAYGFRFLGGNSVLIPTISTQTVQSPSTGNLNLGGGSETTVVIGGTAAGFTGGVALKAGTGPFAITASAATSGAHNLFTLTAPADTNQTASTEVSVMNMIGATRQYATGALTLNRDYRFQPMTHSFVAASTETTGATMGVDGPPIVGTNATIAEPVDVLLQYNAIGQNFAVGNAVGLSLQNTTAATLSVQQYSPLMEQCGAGWKSNATAASQAVCYATGVQAGTFSTSATGSWNVYQSINGAAYAAVLSMSTGGTFTVTGSVSASNFNSNASVTAGSGVYIMSGSGLDRSGAANFAIAPNNANAVTIGHAGITTAIAGTATAAAGTGTQVSTVGGTIFKSATATPSVTTGEVDAISYTMPANTLTTDGQRIHLVASFKHAANTNATTAKAYFAGTNIAAKADSVSSGTDIFDIWIIRTSSTTAQYGGYLLNSAGLSVAGGTNNTITGLDFTTALIAKTTVTGATTNGDLSSAAMSVDYSP